MTLTETRPETAPAVARTVTPPAMGGLAGWLTTADHKKVGRLYVAWSLLFLIGAAVLAVLVALERVDVDGFQIVGEDVADQLTTMHREGLVFFGVVPLLLGLGVAVVPLQVGATSIAFPRAAATSFWLWLAGAGLFIGGYAANGGPGGGDGEGVELYVLGLGMALLGLLLGAICVATTVISFRAVGMRLEEVPFFSWAWLATAGALLMTVPALLANLILLGIDHRYGGVLQPQGISGPFMAQGFAWATHQPMVFAYALPALGIVADVVPVFARARQQLPSVVLGGIGFGALVGVGSFAQAWLRDDVLEEPTFVILSFAAVLPVLVVMALGGLTLRSGEPKVGAPLTLALVTGLALLGGAAAAAVGSIPPLETAFHDGLGGPTAWLDGQLYLVVAGALLGGLAGLAYWGPKLWGRLLPAGPAQGLGALVLLGGALWGIPLLVAGVIDQPYGAATFAEEDASAALNGLSAAGAALTGLAVLGLVLLMLSAFTRGAQAGADPWEGHTLEWATSSPPPAVNFPEPLGLVSSDRPLLDTREAAMEVAR